MRRGVVLLAATMSGAVVASVVVAGPGTGAVDEGRAKSETDAMVIRVIDGSTVEVDLAGKAYEVRYAGIGVPSEGETPYSGEEVRSRESELVEGQTVRLERDVTDIDEEGRLIRYVWVGDTMVNAELVRLGYAWAESRPPDVRYERLLLDLERQARESRLGFWAEPLPQRYDNPRQGYEIEYPGHWKVVSAGPERLILGRDDGTTYGFVTISAIDSLEPPDRVADTYADYLAAVFGSQWQDFEVTYSHEPGGKWSWVLGFAYVDVLGAGPVAGLGEAYILRTADGRAFVVQCDGDTTQLGVCKRVVDSFVVTEPEPPGLLAGDPHMSGVHSGLG